VPTTASDTQRVSAPVCAVEGCVHAKLHARGMCNKHYKRWRKHGDPQGRAWHPQSNDGPCAVEDCASPAMARGFCGKHYQRRRTHGDPLKVASPGRPRVTLPCKMDGCEGEHYARGLCRKHYQRLRTHGDPFKVAKPQTAESPLCVVDGCEGEHASRGFCSKHYQRWQRHGDPSIRSKPRRVPARPADARLGAR
jgi:hypothetical protein